MHNTSSPTMHIPTFNMLTYITVILTWPVQIFCFQLKLKTYPSVWRKERLNQAEDFSSRIPAAILVNCWSLHTLDLTGMKVTPMKQPRKQGSWGLHVAHLGTAGPRWAPFWPHEPCYQGAVNFAITLTYKYWQHENRKGGSLHRLQAIT